MQASHCPKLPGDNERFCLRAWSFLALYFWAWCWKQQGNGLAVAEDLLCWMEPLETSKRRALSFQVFLKQDPPLSSCCRRSWPGPWARCSLPSPPVFSCPCHVPGRTTSVSWSISNYGIFQPSLCEHSWLRGRLYVKLHRPDTRRW